MHHSQCYAISPGGKAKKKPLPVQPPESNRFHQRKDMSLTKNEVPPQQDEMQYVAPEQLTGQQVTRSGVAQAPKQALDTFQNRKDTEQVKWRHMFMQYFKYLQDNIDPVELRNNLYKENFLVSDSVKFRMSDIRCIKATQVIIAVAHEIIDESSYDKFTEILRNSKLVCCADKLEEKLQSSDSLHAEKTENVIEHNTLLTEAKYTIEEGLLKLKKEQVLNIVGNFMNKNIFDLSDIDEIVKYILAGKNNLMAKGLTEMIIKYTGKGSYGCLLHILQQHPKNNRMTQIRYIIQPQICQDKQVKELPDKSVLRKAAKTLTSKVCEQHDCQITKIKEGCIIIYLKSLKRENLNDKDAIKKHFKDGSILESLKLLVEDKEIKAIHPDIAIELVRVEIKTKAEENGNAKHHPLSIIEANKSFLIEEIETGILCAAFEKRGIIDFEQKRLDLNANRRTRARQFLDIVESTCLTETFMDILEEEEMEEMSYIADRLRRYQSIFMTDVDSSILARCMLLKFDELVNILDIDDIEDVFLERRFLNQKIFDDLHKASSDVSVAAILIEILNSGKDAMLCLIDVLFMKGESTLAKSFLDSASTDSQGVSLNTENNFEDYLSNNGTEFSITIRFADRKGIQGPNSDFIIKESFVRQKNTDATSAAVDVKSLDSGYVSPQSSTEVKIDGVNISNESTSKSPRSLNPLEVVVGLKKKIQEDTQRKKKIQEDIQRRHVLTRSDDVAYLYIAVWFMNDLKVEMKKFEKKLLDWFNSTQLVIEILQCLANELDDHFSKINKAKIGGSSAAIVGSVLGIVGLSLAPFTFGASLGLSIAGGVVAGIGGVTVGGSLIADNVLSNKTKTKAEETLKTYSIDISLIKETCLDLGTYLKLIGTLKDDFPEWVEFWMHFAHGQTSDIDTLDWNETEDLISTSIAGIESAARFVGEGVGSGIRIAGAALRVTGSSLHVASGVIGALMIPFDIYTIVDSAIDLHKKNKHKTSKLIINIAKAITDEIPTEESIKTMIGCTLTKMPV